MKDREILGKLTKQEKVDPIIKNKIPNTFVISIPSPLSSYFSRFTQVNRPNTILLIIKGDISFERILRATKKINTANEFNERLDFDGVVLTKLDGDTRGGAALSIRSVVDKPIKFVSAGEKLDSLDVFAEPAAWPVSAVVDAVQHSHLVGISYYISAVACYLHPAIPAVRYRCHNP